MRLKLIFALWAWTEIAVLTLSGCSSPPAPTGAPAAGPPTLNLTPAQLRYVAVTTLGEQDFSPQLSLVGSVDFDQNRSVPVYSAYAGRVEQVYAQLGDDVRAGQPLFALNSPDLAQAESTLLTAAAAHAQADQQLARARQLLAIKGMAAKDYEPAVSAQASAAAAYLAARASLTAFGLGPSSIDQLLAARRIDSRLQVASPVAGRITANNVQPGLFIQPGNAPAPFTVSDLATVWVQTAVPEDDSEQLKVGDLARIQFSALPGRHFDGQLSVIGPIVDATTRTVTARVPLADPQHLLRPGMYANVTLETGAKIHSPALPVAGVVREGDGSTRAWVTRDGRHFEQRTVRLGLQQNGYFQVLAGLRPGEQVASQGALFLNNAAALAQP